MLARHPAVTLFCAEDNRAARAVYERVGFEVIFHNRSFLLEPGTAACSPAYA
jgi:predicted GNAT family acetyltransferase